MDSEGEMFTKYIGAYFRYSHFKGAAFDSGVGFELLYFVASWVSSFLLGRGWGSA